MCVNQIKTANNTVDNLVFCIWKCNEAVPEKLMINFFGLSSAVVLCFYLLNIVIEK